jgi:eukaryotic-like serine/threonine-protein kinase
LESFELVGEFPVIDREKHDETTSIPPPGSLFRCACGNDVALESGKGICEKCRRPVSLASLNASQTMSFVSGAESSSLTFPSKDRSTQRLGHFSLISQLGQGGMGTVYKALDVSLQRFVAVKVMRCASSDGSSAARVTRLLDEAVAQARLNHPHVVTIYYVGRDSQDPFFAMELLPGPTLDKRLSEGPLPYPEVIRFARQVTSALMQATTMNLVHGDVKPSNLIMANAETVKLGDFGLAYMDQRSSTGISGTLNYMAPELAEGSAPTVQSDMYALGITLFELTFGRRPYSLSGQTISDQLKCHRSANIEFPEKWPVAVPESWRHILERLMAKEPGQRYPDYDSLDRDLQSIAPVGVTLAGRINRFLAFGLDNFLQLILLAPLSLPAMLASSSFYDDSTVPFLLRNGLGLVSLLALAVPAAMAWLEWKGWRTPGRYLFQLRVVDLHGLRISRRKRLLRGIVRNAPIWFVALWICALAIELRLPALLPGHLDKILAVAVNALAIFGPRRLALHDRLVGSHVVLDTTQRM